MASQDNKTTKPVMASQMELRDYFAASVRIPWDELRNMVIYVKTQRWKEANKDQVSEVFEGLVGTAANRQTASVQEIQNRIKLHYGMGVTQ